MYKDKIDEKNIGYLKEDSRESFVDIGKKLKLSESAVRRRVKNLVVSKTINKFTIELGEDNVTSAIVLVSVDSATDTSRVSLKLAKLDGVKTVYEITGQYDITTIMSATSIAEINNSIDALRKITGVVDTNTVIILKKVI
jgi:DNA-binding Lrp family transcriptional regulator